MKILLLGDYSSVHLNLKEALEKLGNNVLLIGTGDGFKEIPADIIFGHKKSKILDKILLRLKPFLYLKEFCDFDIVQLMTPYFLKINYFPTNLYYEFLKNNNKKIFMLAGGTDAYYWKYGPKKLKYGPFEDILKYDIKSISYQSDKSFQFNKQFSYEVDGIIPILHELKVCYEPHPKLKPLIPIPINTEKIKFTENKPKKKLIIFHGLNRYGFKGTKYVEKAFNILRDKYPEDLELIIKGKLPLSEYLELMNKTNVVIDQTSSYSLGVNGLYALAKGKVVLGGAEPECLESMGVKESPVINILPDVDDIVKKIENLLDNRSNIPSIGEKSRLFCEENHDYIKVAKKYIEIWNAC